jgi:hypothetical protein
MGCRDGTGASGRGGVDVRGHCLLAHTVTPVRLVLAEFDSGRNHLHVREITEADGVILA